jgi:hypothetical protein
MMDEMKALTEAENPRIKAPNMLWHVRKSYTPQDGPKASEFENVPILTDDYAPVDTSCVAGLIGPAWI